MQPQTITTIWPEDERDRKRAPSVCKRVQGPPSWQRPLSSSMLCNKNAHLPVGILLASKTQCMCRPPLTEKSAPVA